MDYDIFFIYTLFVCSAGFATCFPMQQKALKHKRSIPKLLSRNFAARDMMFISNPIVSVSNQLYRNVVAQDMMFISNPIFPDPAIYSQFQQASVIHLILFSLLLLSGQKSLTFQGLVHSAFLGLGLFTFLGFKVD